MASQKNHRLIKGAASRLTTRTIFPAALLLLLGACSEQQAPPPEQETTAVELVAVTQPSSGQIREFSGRIEQTAVSPLAAEVAGRVVEIAVLDGTQVKRGQLIARIDPEPYELQLQRATAQYKQLSADLVRKRQLREDRILSEGALEQLEAATEMARVQQELARRDLRNTRLVAPFDGRLARRNIELLQTVQVGVPAFNLENSERLDVSVDLPQNLVQRLPLDNTLKATVWLPEKPDMQFNLTYREHATQGTSSSGVFRLVFSGKRPADLSLLVGMSVRVRIDIPESQLGDINQQLQSVPVTALSVSNDGKHFVWRFNPQEGKVQAVPVQVQSMQQKEALIQSPLQIGDQVVAAGSQFLREGQRVHTIGQ